MIASIIINFDMVFKNKEEWIDVASFLFHTFNVIRFY